MAARYQFLGPSLKAGGRLTLHCTRCDYTVIMPANVAIARYGPGSSPQGVRERSRCSVCGKTDRIAVST